MHFKAISVVATALLSVTLSAKVDFAKADRLYRLKENHPACQSELEAQLAAAENNLEKAQGLWRLSRLQCDLGDQQSAVEKKRAYYDKGIKYAEDGMKLNPNSAECLMWHSANMGRKGQTGSFSDLIKSADTITGDFYKIIDKLGRTDYTEAWVAMTEYFHQHPFKSSVKAVSYARKAVSCIPKSEIAVYNYVLLAKLLYERDWSASRRNSQFAGFGEDFAKSKGPHTDRFSYFEGKLGAAHIPVWSTVTLGEMSDREEARAIAAHIEKKYKEYADKTSYDMRSYAELKKLTAGWK